MSDNRKSFFKKAVSFVLSLLIFVFLTLMTFLTCAYYGLMSPGIPLKALEASGYYESAANQFEENAWDISIPLGLPRTVTQGLVSPEKVEADMNVSVRSRLSDEIGLVDAKELQQVAHQRVVSHFTSLGKNLSNEQLSVLSIFEEKLGAEYMGLTDLGIFKILGDLKAYFSKIYFGGMALLVALTVISASMLTAMHRLPHRGIRWITYSTTAAAVAVSVPPVFLFVSKFHWGISLSPSYFKAFITGWVDQVMLFQLLCGLLMVLLTAFSILAIYLLKRAMFARMKANAARYPHLKRGGRTEGGAHQEKNGRAQ